MRVGQDVVCVDKGKVSAAVVAGLAPENGASGHKRLDLLVEGKTLKDVPHEVDADGGVFWAFGAPKRSKK